MNRSPAEIRDRWLNYGRRYARYPTLWDSSLAFASGPLAPEAGTLRDYSGRTSGAVRSVGAGDVPKYVQGSVRGVPFWAGQYDGSDDEVSMGPLLNFAGASTFSVSTWVRTSAAAAIIAAHDGNNIDKRAWRFWKFADKLEFYTWPSGVAAGGTVVQSLLGAVPVTWSHVGCSLYSGVGRLFVAGRQVAQNSSMASVYDTGGDVVAKIGAAGSVAGTGTGNFLGDIASVCIFSRTLSDSEWAALARHPLEAYRVEVPRYWSFATSTHLWPWQIRRSRRVRGHR